MDFPWLLTNDTPAAGSAIGAPTEKRQRKSHADRWNLKYFFILFRVLRAAMRLLDWRQKLRLSHISDDQLRHNAMTLIS